MGAANYVGNHDFQPYEQDANRRAFNYFNKNVGGFYQTRTEYGFNRINGIRKGWDFHNNPFNVNHSKTRNYYDYKNEKDRNLINSLSLKAKWYDYLDPFGLYVGIGNGIYYNNNRVK